MSGWRLGIDIGGTFTDVIAVAGAARRSAKVPSQPQEPVRAIVDAIAAVGLTWDLVDEIVHGTTIVTNDIVQGRFRPCALVATQGFADTIEIGRGSRRHLYRLEPTPRAPALVARPHRFEVAERIGHDGSVITALADAEIERVVAQVAAGGLDTVAVCLLHAFRNPEHEARLGARLREVAANVSLSHEISPEFREFERMNTTVLNAMMMASIKRHLALIDQEKPATSRLHLMHSASGMAAPELIAERPLMLAMSGPAAGVSASCKATADLGIENAVTLDMGGTTTDICLIVKQRAEIAVNRELGGVRIRMPMVAVDSIGAGGGSIARLVSGALIVGPESAGARPGPACYGKGGTLPTVSDADLILGYLNEARTLGGSVHLSLEKAIAAVEPLAHAIGFTVVGAAAGIARVVHANMARAVRRTTVERGVDVRDFAMIAFGGAGPMHAAEVARLCGIHRITVPAYSSGFSALGCVDAAMSYSRQLTVGMKSGAWNAARLDALIGAEINELAVALMRAGHGRESLRISHTAGIRYSGQSYETPIADPALDDVITLGIQFDRAHRAQYGYATGEPWELVSLRTEVAASQIAGELATTAAVETTTVPVDRRIVTFESGESRTVNVLDRSCLPRNKRLAGPLIIEDEWSTTLLPPGDGVRMDAAGNLQIEVAL